MTENKLTFEEDELFPKPRAPPSGRREPNLERILEMKRNCDLWRKLQRTGGKKPAGASTELQIASEPVADAKAGPASNVLDFLCELDLLILRHRLYQIATQNGIQLKQNEVEQLLESCVIEAKASQGFDLYGTADEEGLHDGNTQEEGYDDQDDYDVEELHGEDTFLYEYGPTHHIEVELNDGPRRSTSPDSNEPSCEFTFEYDGNGKLIPTSSNIEEKLRLMSLQTRIAEGGRKKKKSLRRKKRLAAETQAAGPCEDATCYLCQFEYLYGMRASATINYIEEFENVLARLRQNAEVEKILAQNRGEDESEEDEEE